MPFDATPLPQRDDVVELLEKGRALVAAHWCRHRLHSARRDKKSGEVTHYYCMIGAICTAAGHSELGLGSSDTLYIARNFLAFAVDMPRQCVENWNDTKGRKKDEVVAAFDRAIVLRQAALDASRAQLVMSL